MKNDFYTRFPERVRVMQPNGTYYTRTVTPEDKQRRLDLVTTLQAAGVRRKAKWL